jgi:3-(3-hydroxy-phenyl)propionate hydroxylase
MLGGEHPMPPGFPMLGPGVFQCEPDGFIGSLGLQARVTVPGGVGRFDDMLGARRWALLIRGGAAHDLLDAVRLRVLSELDAIAVEVLSTGSTPRDGAIVDVDGRYEAWMDEHAVQAVLTRPDFAVFGAAQRPADVSDLIDSVAHELEQVLVA